MSALATAWAYVRRPHTWGIALVGALVVAGIALAVVTGQRDTARALASRLAAERDALRSEVAAEMRLRRRRTSARLAREARDAAIQGTRDRALEEVDARRSEVATADDDELAELLNREVPP